MPSRKNPSFPLILAPLFPVIVFLVITCGGESPEIPDETGAIDSIAPAAVTDLLTKAPTTGSITLVWTSPGDDGMVGSATQYDVRYSTGVITDQNWDSAIQVEGEPMPKTADVPETFQVTGLIPSKHYYFALKSKDNVFNESDLSNVAEGTTNQETSSPSSVTDLSAIAVDDTSFMLTWTAPGDDGTAGAASQYDVRYSTQPIDELNWSTAEQAAGEPQPGIGGSIESFTITGLAPLTNYFFMLKAADEVPNWSELSNLAPAIAYGVFLWVYPGSIQAGEEIQIIYRVSSEHATALTLARRAFNYQCGDPYRLMMIEGTFPTGIYSMTYNFYEHILNGYLTPDRYFIALCWDLERKGIAQVTFEEQP